MVVDFSEAYRLVLLTNAVKDPSVSHAELGDDLERFSADERGIEVKRTL